jgi:hypothetical protein
LSFLSLLELPWFSRIWVKQEYIVSPQITLQYGTLTLSLSDLYPIGMMLPSAPKFKLILQSVIKANRGEYIKILKLGSTMQQIQVLDRGRKTYDPEKGSIYPLLDFLSLFRDNDATDQRDKIYGLLGLPGPSSKAKAETTVTGTAAHNESLGYDPEVLVVDYAAPVQEVYKSLVQARRSRDSKNKHHMYVSSRWNETSTNMGPRLVTALDSRTCRFFAA